MTEIEKKLQRMKDFIVTEEYKKYTANHMVGLSRTDRKNLERKEEKLKKCINSLTPMQLELIESRAEMIANERIEDFKGPLDRAISALLIEFFPEKSFDEIEKLEKYYSSLVMEDVQKDQGIKNMARGDYEMGKKIIQKYENEVQAKCEELLAAGVNQKQAIEILVTQFPSLSKSMLTNGYKKVKSLWEKEQAEAVDPDVEEAAEAIMDILEEQKEEIKVDKIIEEADKFVEQAEKEELQPKLICDGNSCRIDTTEDNAILCGTTEVKEENKVMAEVKSEVKKPGLKVLSMTVKGENGTYRVCEQGVELAGENQLISFASEAELDEWVSEYKQVFAMIK